MSESSSINENNGHWVENGMNGRERANENDNGSRERTDQGVNGRAGAYNVICHIRNDQCGQVLQWSFVFVYVYMWLLPKIQERTSQLQRPKPNECRSQYARHLIRHLIMMNTININTINTITIIIIIIIMNNNINRSNHWIGQVSPVCVSVEYTRHSCISLDDAFALLVSQVEGVRNGSRPTLDKTRARHTVSVRLRLVCPYSTRR